MREKGRERERERRREKGEKGCDCGGWVAKRSERKERGI